MSKKEVFKMTREQKTAYSAFLQSALWADLWADMQFTITVMCSVTHRQQIWFTLSAKIFTGDFEGVVFIVIALLTYILGNVFFVIADRFIKLETKTVSLIASAVALLIIGIFPNISNN